MLPRIRALPFAGEQAAADSLASASFGDLHLRFPRVDTSVSGYRRDLDLDHAVATTRFKVGGTTCTRQVFASYP